MMQPMDTEARSRLAAERFELLQNDATSPSRPPRPVRLRVGGLLVAAGLRLAPETRLHPSHASLWLRSAEPSRSPER